MRFFSSIFLCLLCAAGSFGIVHGLKRSTQEEKGVAAAANPQASEENPPTAKAEAPSAENSALIAEWEQLRSEFGDSNDAFPAIFATIKDIKDTFRRRAFRAALVAEWMARDPAGGLEFFREKESWLASQAVREWLRIDPNAAVTGLMASGGKWQGIARDVLKDIARSAPNRVAEVAVHLPKPDRWDTRVRDAFEFVAGKDGLGWEQALALLEGKAADAMPEWARRQAMEGIAKAYGEKDGAAAMAWARTLPEGQRDDALRAALAGWARTAPLEALNHVNEVPPGGDPMYYASDAGARVLSEAAKIDFEGTLRWLKENPGKLGRESMSGLTSAVSKQLATNPADTLELLRGSDVLAASMVLSNSLLNEGYSSKDEVWKWLDAQPQDQFTKEARMALLRAAAWKEPDEALTLMQHLPAGPEKEDILRQTVGSLINNGADAGRLDDLLSKVSPEVRPHLIETAFQYGLRGFSPAEVTKWIERAQELPAEKQPMALGQIASQWTAADPQAALQWVNSLPEEQRMIAMSQAASSWARVDSYEASEWMATLPPSHLRDVAVGALVGAIASSEPDSAWQWARTLIDPIERQNAFAQTLLQLHREDPGLARQMLQTTTLPAEEKQVLSTHLDALDKRGSGETPTGVIIRSYGR